MKMRTSRRSNHTGSDSCKSEFDTMNVSVVKHRANMQRRRRSAKKMNKRTQAGSGNPKRRKGGLAKNEMQLDNANTPAASSSPIPDQHPPFDSTKAKQVVIKWLCVFLSALLYMELKRRWTKQEEENPMSDEREY